VVELVAPAGAPAAEAASVVGELRSAVAGRAPALLGAGLHPLAAFGDVRRPAGHRYDGLVGAA
jgi:hypothetical protein